MDAENEYWQSYSLTITPVAEEATYSFHPPTLNPQHLVKLSILLDCEARYDFSAIRLIVFCESLDILNYLAIMGYHYFGEVSSVRDLALRRRYISQLLANYDGPSKSDLSPGKVCMVAFDICQQGAFHEFGLVETTAQPSDLDPNATSFRRVAYDCTFPISSYDSSVIVFLRFNRSNVQPWAIPEPYYNLPTHSIRILPMPSRRRSPCITLPPSIIRHIVSLAIDSVRKLLSYALVCKAWEHVLELFFESFGNNHVEVTPAYPGQILRTLRWRPQYGALIRRLSYNDFHVGSWGEPPDDLWETFFGIMGYATSASYFHLPKLPRNLLDENMDALCNLPNISESFFGQKSFWVTRDHHAMSMAYIQIVIMKWKKLKGLSIVGWGKAREHNSKRALPGDLQCSIERLKLHHGYLTADQLFYFSSSTRSSLSKIDFYHLTGPSNSDFRQFLSSAAATLKIVVVKSCEFTPHFGEELALDAVMPEMTVLQELWVSDHVISTLSLTRKPYSVPELPSTITIQCDYSSLEIEYFEEAIRTTHWGAVSVYNIPWDWYPSIVSRVEETARNRGIDISMVDHYPGSQSYYTESLGAE